MKVTVRLDKAAIKRISDAAKLAAVDTMEQVYTDLVSDSHGTFQAEQSLLCLA